MENIKVLKTELVRVSGSCGVRVEVLTSNILQSTFSAHPGRRKYIKYIIYLKGPPVKSMTQK